MSDDEPTENPEPEVTWGNPLAIFDQVEQVVALWTGIRQKWLDAGFSEHAAEVLTVDMYRVQMHSQMTA